MHQCVCARAAVCETKRELKIITVPAKLIYLFIFACLGTCECMTDRKKKQADVNSAMKVGLQNMMTYVRVLHGQKSLLSLLAKFMGCIQDVVQFSKCFKTEVGKAGMDQGLIWRI